MQYRIEDLAVLILQNLPEVTIEQLNTVLQHIEYTRCAYLKGVFEFAAAFYNQNDNKMPDEDYMNLQFESIFYVTNIPFHPQLIDDFIRFIITESVAVQSQKALQQGNFRKAAGIIQSAEKTTSAPILTMREVLKLWKENKKEFSFGLKTGIPELDEVYKFLGYKTLNVFAAPPANFKTTVACSMAMNAILNQGLNVVYITLEDTSEIIYHNMLAALAGREKINITAEEIKRYLLPENKEDLLEELVNKWDNIKGKFAVLSARECDSFTPAQISRKLDEIYKQWDEKLDVVIVDHFNIMNDPIPGLQLQGPQLAKHYVRFMTNLAISFGHKGFILVGLAQINREGQLKIEKGKELNGSELADTSELHRSATTVTSLYADDTDRTNGLIKIKNVKNRLGPQGQMFMVPIYPAQFMVGDDTSSLSSMSIDEFEKL
jgi:replicative DNA helicase